MNHLDRISRLQDSLPPPSTQARYDWLAQHLDEIRDLAATSGRSVGIMADLLGMDRLVLGRKLQEG
jgi:hypothetical protein